MALSVPFHGEWKHEKIAQFLYAPARSQKERSFVVSEWPQWIAVGLVPLPTQRMPGTCTAEPLRPRPVAHPLLAIALRFRPWAIALPLDPLGGVMGRPQ